eukprot:Nk52_evm22s136 gene=Nk52_evmTU22s136
MSEQLQKQILSSVDKAGKIESDKFANEMQIDHQSVVGAIKSLQAMGTVIDALQKEFQDWKLTKEGETMANGGSFEYKVFCAVPEEGGISQADLMKIGAEAKIGFSKAMSAGWIAIDKKAEGGPWVTRKVSSVVDKVQSDLKSIQSKGNAEENALKDLKKRKLIVSSTKKVLTVTKGADFTLNLQKAETDLTAEMIANGSWKDKKFKEYNFDSLGVMPHCGHLHPLQKVRTRFRESFLNMGFTEMPTNNFVESSFWNFDSLFQPQAHPARDSHDTFFLKSPVNAKTFPAEYLERVRKTHETGGYGSIGYRCDWKIEEAAKNILRTHTTAVTARMLYKLAQEKPFKPAKYFSIDRVFRNEALDATHLAEFHQIEGCIVDYNLSLGDMIGVINQFFTQLGFDKIRFKPAYNPYTEPSMEIFAFHEGLGKWVEIGNSGMFRPEMLEPMGLPKDVTAIAWGLSLERPTMIQYGFDNIRDLVGHKVNLQMVNENPVCRL